MRVLVTGGNGFIAGHALRALRERGHETIASVRAPASGAAPRLDLLDLPSIPRTLDALRPDAVLHAAAMRDLAQCEREPDAATRVNVDATRAIARWCAGARAPLVFLSTDQVFSGDPSLAPYREADPRRPLNRYGVTKALAEDLCLSFPGACVVRVALTLGRSPTGDRTPNEQIARAVRAGQPVTLFSDEYRTPVLVDDLAAALAELIALPKPPPVVHLAGPDRVSRVELGHTIAQVLRLPTASFRVRSSAEVDTGVRRALDTSLDACLAAQVLRTRLRSLAEVGAELAREGEAR